MNSRCVLPSDASLAVIGGGVLDNSLLYRLSRATASSTGALPIGHDAADDSFANLGKVPA